MQTAIAGHALDAVETLSVYPVRAADHAFHIMECDDINAATQWAHKLLTYGYVEVRELLQY